MPVPTRQTIVDTLPGLCRDIHASNITAGWWTNLKTSESILATRNRPEMLMLAVSEIAEAAEGMSGDSDDKLPHRPMYDVELADYVIRQLDQIGAEVSLGQEMPKFELGFAFQGQDEMWTSDLLIFRAMSRADRLLALMLNPARAMEHYRKGRVEAYLRCMAEGVIEAFQIAEVDHINLFDIIAEKRAFNAVREDHQAENRRGEDGKRF